jgi:hypothetical protein
VVAPHCVDRPPAFQGDTFAVAAAKLFLAGFSRREDTWGIHRVTLLAVCKDMRSFPLSAVFEILTHLTLISPPCWLTRTA